jgi:hypothetical protein
MKNIIYKISKIYDIIYYLQIFLEFDDKINFSKVINNKLIKNFNILINKISKNDYRYNILLKIPKKHFLNNITKVYLPINIEYKWMDVDMFYMIEIINNNNNYTITYYFNMYDQLNGFKKIIYKNMI